jgi:tetratricopeptide (TPR) repeat protein
VLYILRIAATDYGKETTLLVKSPCPPDGDSGLRNTQGNSDGQPHLRPAVSARPPAARPVTGVSGRMEQLLIAVSVYRAAADRNAILFQLGERGWPAAHAPDGRGPAPPYQTPADLTQLIASCAEAELIWAVSASADPAAGADSWIVEPWLAGQIHRQLEAVGRRDELVTAHRRAAEYWQWRAAAWPQGRRDDLHDLLEARHHLFAAGDVEQASKVTHTICAQLHAWGDLGREAELIQSTLGLLPSGTADWANWMHELGAIYQVRREHDEARRCYGAATEIFATVGDYRGVARGQHSLGVLAQAHGDYRRAERHYRRSSAAEKKAAARQQAAGSEGDARPTEDIPAEAAAPPAAAGSAGPGIGRRREFEQLADPAAGSARPRPDRAPRRGNTAAQSGTTAAPPAGQASAPARSGAAVTTPAVTTPAVTATAGAATTPAASAPAAPAPAAPAPATPAPAASAPAASAPATPAADTAAGQTSPHADRLRGRTGSILLVLGLAAAAVAVVGALLVLPGAHPRPGGSTAPGATSPGVVRLAAAAWVSSQVSRSAVVGCDPAMCAALMQRGVPAGDLLELGPSGATDPLASNVVVATAALRAEYGLRLADVYAPEVLAAFGGGSAAIQVRAVAPDGAPAFTAAMHSDLEARREFGASLLLNRHLLVSARAKAQLADGEVDSRLLATLATIADIEPLRIIAFGDAGPGAGGAVPLRSVVIAPTGGVGSAWASSVLTFLDAQQTPFRPASAGWDVLPGYPYALRIQYSSPSPLGLLTTSGASQGSPSTHE